MGLLGHLGRLVDIQRRGVGAELDHDRDSRLRGRGVCDYHVLGIARQHLQYIGYKQAGSSPATTITIRTNEKRGQEGEHEHPFVQQRRTSSTERSEVINTTRASISFLML